MSRRPEKNPPAPGDQVRISFLLDRRTTPQLSHLLDLQGHGERPRELIRLAILGLQAEEELKALTDAARRATLASLAELLPHQAGHGIRYPAGQTQSAENQEAAPAVENKDLPEPQKTRVEPAVPSEVPPPAAEKEVKKPNLQQEGLNAEPRPSTGPAKEKTKPDLPGGFLA